MCCSVVRGKAVKNLVKFNGQIIADLTTNHAGHIKRSWMKNLVERHGESMVDPSDKSV